MSNIPDIIDRLVAAVREDSPPQRALLVSAAAEIERLRFVIRRLADQDATLSVCDGNVTVTMDATLTDEERAAVRTAAGCMGMWMLENGVTEDESMQRSSATLRGLLERLN